MGVVRNREFGGDTKAIAQLVSALVMLKEEEDEREKQAGRMLLLDDQSALDANYAKKTSSILDYYQLLSSQEQQMNDEEADAERQRRNKRSRSVAASAAAVSTAGLGDDPSNANNDGRNVGVTSTTSTAAPTTRRLWVKDRSRAWWENVDRPDFPESDFRRAFRMSRSTFDMICGELSSAVEKEDTMLRAAIPVRQRVAVCIWRLATGEPLRLVSKRFGLGISTCHKLVLEVCAAIKSVLMPRFLQWPASDEHLQAIMDRFQAGSGIPGVVGSMYTTHIPIIAPKMNVAAYFNKRHTERNHKTSYSITLQGVVDPSGVFTDVCIGWPGSMPDEQVLEKSALYQRGLEGMLKGMWVVGGPSYPLMDWVLVPYAQQHLTWTQHAFNEKIGEVQRNAREAFARLKRRWSCLQKRTEVKLQDLPVLLGACCVLHNICEQRNEAIEPDLDFQLVDDEMLPENCIRSHTAMQARDSIAHNLLHHAHAGTAFLS
ncbi:putative nuclease [Nymphaea thermarum]|nr:putative nuclease [Nymphaea thermarum]